MKVSIDGKLYNVKESLGFQGGYQAKIIDYNGEEKVAVRENGGWRLWTSMDKLQQGGRYIPQGEC
jgi:hypothetical protein